MALYRPCVWTYDQLSSRRCCGHAPRLVARAEARHPGRGGRSRHDRLGGSPPAWSALQPAVPMAARLADRAAGWDCRRAAELYPARPASLGPSDSRRAGRVGPDRDRAVGRAPGAGRSRGGPGAPAGRDRRAAGPMIPVPSGSRVSLATGHTDMRKGFDDLAALVQDHLARDPYIHIDFFAKNECVTPKISICEYPILFKCSMISLSILPLSSISISFSKISQPSHIEADIM